LRTLVYIPIVHSEADMGDFKESVKQAAFQTIGKTGWRQNMIRIDQLWSKIAAVVLNLVLPYPHVRLYQDALPVCGHEMDIVRELAEKGSLNHRLLLDLTARGAVLMGTESAELLLAEYTLQQDILTAKNSRMVREEKMNLQAAGDDLLRRRDAFIARRINETLQTDETGILFLGVLHDVGNALNGDIQQLYPIGRPLGRSQNKRGS
jgi:hypothetical protein